MNRNFFLSLSLLFLPFFVHSQNASIIGKIFNNSNGESLPDAYVQIDGLKKGVNSDASGNFYFQNLSSGRFKLKVIYLGFENYEKEIILSNNQTLNLRIGLTEKSNELNTITVFSSINKETDAASRSTEKNSNNITNVIGALAILRSPDINAANVLTRVSGVTIQKNSGGDEAYAVIRGVEPRYNNTLINGVKISSPDEKARFISLNVIPSELLQRIEVSKSLTPDMEGDAIGGTVNLIFKDATSDSLLFNASASAGYSAIFLDRKFTDFSKTDIQTQSVYDRIGADYAAKSGDFSRTNLDFQQKNALPNASLGLTLGKRFFNNKLGVLVADNYQNQFYGSDSQFNNAVPNPNNGFIPYITDIANRTYSNQQLNNGLILHADYNINDKNKLTVNNVLLYSYFAQAFQSTDTTLVGGDAGRSLYRGQPVLGTGSIHQNYRSVTNNQILENLKVEGKHILSEHFLLDWAGVYSDATKKAPDRAEFATNKRISYDSVANQFNSTPYYYDGGTRIWQQNEDKDLNSLLNLTYKTKLKENLLEVKVGGLYRHKVRDNFQNQYNQFAVGGNNSIGSRQQFSTIYEARDSIINPNGTAGYDLNNYHAFENISAGFGQFKFLFPKLDIIGGVRIENTSQGYHYLQIVQDAVDNVTKTYTDILPSIQLKYRLNNKTNIRASFFESLSRPNYFEIIPYTIRGNDGFNEKGNPNLQHTTAENYDLRYELFPKADQQFFVGAFFKQLHNPIENAFVSAGSILVFQPINTAATANIFGGELVYAKYFGNIGITGNYSYTYSSINGSKLDPTTGKAVTESRPLQGQADNELNLSLEYKSEKHKFFVQLAYQYIGKTLTLVYPNPGYDYYQQPQSFLSLSADKTINKFTIFGKFNNLLNTPTTIKVADLVTGRDVSKASVILGIRYTH